MEFETVIGLEVHAELATKTKAFCSCEVTFGKAANTYCCPVCMGLPGAMPVINKRAVEYAHMLGIATNCKINLKSQFARKNYFYPDLPKGYQISQSDFPICENGHIMVNDRKIRINRIHIEEDAGKLVHTKGETKVDFNRAGVPLVEIVTEPDLRSNTEAKEFLEKIREILLYLEISHCRMQEGNLRCDVNVSVRKKGEDKYAERCEMKNINSFSGAVRCIEFEEKRQRDILLNGGVIKRETRRWIDEENRSVLLRNKEDGADYRYFPEPDLPVLVIEKTEHERLKQSMPELPDKKRERYKNDYGFSKYECDEIVRVKTFSHMLDEGVSCGGNAKKLYNWLVSDVARIINDKNMTPEDIPFGGKELAELTELIDKGEISNTAGKDVLEAIFTENKPPLEIVKEKGFTQINDTYEIEKLVKLVLLQNEKSVADYKKGKTNAFGYLVGRCMKMTENKANPKVVTEILNKELEK